MDFNSPLTATHGRQNVSRNSPTDDKSQPIFLSSATHPLMDYFAQPSLSVGKLGSDRKRKAADEQQERRVRSGAPPPSDLTMIWGVDSMQQPARQWARDGEGRHSWGKECEESARGLEGVGWNACSSSPSDVGVMPHSTGHWAFVKKERRGFELEDERYGGVLSRFPTMNFRPASPEMQGTPPGHSRYEASISSLSPKMHGTPPGYSGHQITPGVGYVKRKRTEIEDAEDGEVKEPSKRTPFKAVYIQDMKAERAKPTHAQTKAMNAPSPKLPYLDATIPIFPYSGLKLGQLLPCGEILGFVDLPPLAQLYDIYSISLINSQPEHAWIQQTWRAIQTSIGVHAPTWQHNYWCEEINMSGTERKEVTFRAIKTFQELGEKLWRTSIVELMEETLNLFQKEVDYTVLLLLVHRYENDRDMWEQRLKVLFARLEPALRARNTFASPTTPIQASAGASKFETHSYNFDPTPLYQGSGLPAVKGESLKHAASFNPWHYPMGPTGQGYVAQMTLSVKDEPTGGMLW